MTCAIPENTHAIIRHAPHGAVTASLPRLVTSEPAPYGPAPIIAHGPRTAGGRNSIPDLTARALTMCNRDRVAAQRYLALHQILANPTCSEGDA